MKKSKAIVILIVILGALAGLAYYASIILSSTGIGEEMSIPLGLDLSGGVSITYQVVDDNPSAEDMSDLQAAEACRGLQHGGVCLPGGR